jgi:hypothetical protein
MGGYGPYQIDGLLEMGPNPFGLFYYLLAEDGVNKITTQPMVVGFGFG